LARKILLADDSVTAQNMGRRILTDAGYEVITVNNGSAALKKIAEQLPELIVLDVYMPGYSGLEVCQRLKETRETAKIPILLTVGKLEPFKPEEARRARADAFIIKPFEASELLTALTRLEDKIVPQPAQKGGQFAKAWAELEQTDGAGKGEKFGDSETGWKNRLNIPSTAKAEKDEAEETPRKAKGAGDPKSKTKARPAEPAVPVASVPGTVPADITAEEVAAIAAAAAAFEDKSQAACEEFAVNDSAVAEVTVEATAAGPASETKTEEVPVAVATEAVATVETPASAPVEPVVQETPAPVVEAAAHAPAEASIQEEDAKVSPPTETHSTNGNGAAAVVAVIPPPGPQLAKWIAEVVPLAEGEAGINLEDEMNKTYAVLQAATAEADFMAAAAAPAPSVESIAEPMPEPHSEPAVEAVSSSQSEAEAEKEIEPAPPALAEAAPDEDQRQGSAFAAVAAAGPSESGMPASGVATASQPAPKAPEQQQNESELAAAWAQWKQIRESVVGPQLATQIADVAASQIKEAEEKTEVPGELQTAAEPQAAPDTPASAPPSNPTAIANIVDSVLAELKPKLVEEIAKKLGKEKK
jgi:twitching motility two-component system response regulator PilH